MPTSKLGKITFVFDERLSRQKTIALTRLINSLRQFAEVKLVSGNIPEAELVEQLGESTPSLVILPWYRYLSWSKVEGLFGLTRTSGPTCIGYHFGGLKPYELEEQAEHLRAILVDFGGSTAAEVALLARALIQDTQRSGLIPLVGPKATLYTEKWYENHGLGLRLDTLLKLPDYERAGWQPRANCLRLLFTQLWSLVYDEGPGKNLTLGGSAPRAYFQAAFSERVAALRLVYNLPSWTPRSALEAFWPRPERATAASQLLLRHTDFLRVHHVAETNDVEIVAGLFKSAVSERHPDDVHTIWIEPIAASLVSEVPLTEPGPEHPELKPFPLPESLAPPTPRAPDELTEQAAQLRAKDRHLQEAGRQVRELRRQILERDERIAELRAGGVGTAAKPSAPPHADELIEALHDRFNESAYELIELEQRLEQELRRGALPIDLKRIHEQRDQTLRRRDGWVRAIAAILRTYQAERAKRGVA